MSEPVGEVELAAAFSVLNSRMSNVNVSIDGDTMKILIDLKGDYGPSSTGRNNIIATTHGVQLVPGGSRPGLKLGLNVIYKPSKKGARKKK